MSNYATVWYGVVATGAGPIAAGRAVVSVGDGTYAVATSANRALYGRAVGIARTTADSGKPFQFQVAGPYAISSTGSANDHVRVDANGDLERTSSPSTSDDLIGRCPHTSAIMMVLPVLLPISLVAAGAPSGTGVAETTSGVWNAAATGTTGTGLVVKQTSPTFLTDVRYGSTPATFGGSRYTNNWFLWWRGGGSNIPVLGVNASDVIQLGVGGGYPIEIDAANDEITNRASDHVWESQGSTEWMRLNSNGLNLGGSYIGAVCWNDAVIGQHVNIVGNYAPWTGLVPGAFERSRVDNTKVGIVCFGVDTQDGPSNTMGCQNNYTFAVGRMPHIVGEYAGGGGYRAHAYGAGAWAFGKAVFADGDGCFATGQSCVAGAVTVAQGDPAGPKHYCHASGVNSDARATGSFVHGNTCTIDYNSDYAVCLGNNCTADTTATYAFAVGNQCDVHNTAGFGQGVLCIVSGDYGFASGLSCEANSSFATSRGYDCLAHNGQGPTAIGYTCTAANNGAVAMGFNCSASGEGATAIGRDNVVSSTGDFGTSFGFSNNVTSRAATAIGEDLVAEDAQAFVHGYGATAKRKAEYVHGGFAAAEGSAGVYRRCLLKNTSVDNATVALLLADGNELTLDDSKSYRLTVDVLGSRTDAQACGRVIVELLAHSSGGTLVIDDNTARNSTLPVGWTVAISAVATRKLRIDCDGAAGQTVKFCATVTWHEEAGF